MPQSDLIEKLVSYSHDHPMASDTAEGIAQWWVQMPVEEVQAALELLVERGIWEKVKLQDRVLYCPIQSSDSMSSKHKGAISHPHQGPHQNKEESR